MAPDHETPADKRATVGTPNGAISDRRPTPRGVLPRQLQMWLMVGIALVIVLIIIFTGQPAPSVQPAAMTSPTETAASVQPERVRSYQDRLAEQEARLRRDLAGRAADPALPPVAGDVDAPPRAPDPIVQERRRRDYDSLFADNVALSRRPDDQQPYGERGSRRPGSAIDPGAAGFAPPTDLAALQQALAMVPTLMPAARTTVPASTAADVGASPSATRVGGSVQAPASQTEALPLSGPLHRLLEGTVIETVLTNRLDGTFAGPVNCLVTTPVYALSRQYVLIPAGARVLGSASPVEGWGESRLAVRFHRLVFPDGRTVSLDRFQGLNQVGETGLRDRVNRHYWQVFGASIAIGALSGLAQWHTRGSVDATFGDGYRQAAGASLATSTGRVLDRFLNVLPTITIREGHRIKVYLTNDLDLPAYGDAEPGEAPAIAEHTRPGGAR